MISDKTTAEAIDRSMRSCSSALNESIRLVMETCPDEEFQVYRKKVATLMADIYFEVLRPLYRKYPDLEPPELRREQK